MAALLGGGLAVAHAHPPLAMATAAPRFLPSFASTAVTVCPGPQTLIVPAGAQPVAPTGPVVVSAVLRAAAAGTAGGTLSSLIPSDDGGAVAAAAHGQPLVVGATRWLALGSSTRITAGAVRLDAGRLSGAAASAVQLSLGRSGDLRGLAATSCDSATEQAWLVGGGTATGRRGRLLLANPTPTPAVVDVVVHGPGRPVVAAGGQGVVVPAGGVVPLFVDALAPGLAQTAVHVVARSGRMVATLQDTILRGVVPGGVDDVAPSAPPATRQVLAGIVVAAPGTAAVRIAVPGPTDAVVRVALFGPGGPVNLPGTVVTVPAGSVRDVPVTGVPDGVYTAVAEADEPVVAGAVTSVTAPGGQLAGTASAVGRAVPPSDLAWVAAGRPLRGAVTLAVPSLPTVTGAVVVSAPGSGARFGLRAVTADGAAGPTRLVTLAADQTSVLPLAAGTAAVLIDAPAGPGASLYAALLLRTSDAAGPMIAVAPVLPAEPPPGPPLLVVEDENVR